ncbi:hypothetical protein N8692_00930 [Flavobacteriales bacterium]|nr:hypothetical protein [Flavobacteriales bacterium]
MLINHQYKFLFIGLPFSASSAIHHQLHKDFNAIPRLRKHSLYHDFFKSANDKEKKYFVFAVLRNPMDIVISNYEKMKANEKGNFTNPDFFTENGGHINRKQREKFNFINDKSATFQDYFNKYFNKPYDNLASLTTQYCDFLIRYESISTDYLEVLKQIGIKNTLPLKVMNKTKGKKQVDITAYYTDDIKKKAIFVFGPFMRKYNYAFPVSWGYVRISFFSRIFFKLISLFMRINQKYFKSYKNKIDRKGTVFGDIKNANKLS